MKNKRLYINILILILLCIVILSTAAECTIHEANFIIWSIINREWLGQNKAGYSDAENTEIKVSEGSSQKEEYWKEKKKDSKEHIKKDSKQTETSVGTDRSFTEAAKDDPSTSRDTDQDRTTFEKSPANGDTTEDKSTGEATGEATKEKITSARYEGFIDNVDFFVDMTVNLIDRKVTGSITNDWGRSYLATVINGKIDLSNNKVVAEVTGVFVDRETDSSEDANMLIYGTLSQDLNIFNGFLVTEIGEKSFSANLVGVVTD